MLGTARCYAPPITDQMLVDWVKLIPSERTEMQAALTRLYVLVGEYHTIPKPLHSAGLLDKSIKASLDLPLPSEIEAYSAMFETIDPISQKPLRDMAFHLLFYAVELAGGREPLTTDKLTNAK